MDSAAPILVFILGVVLVGLSATAASEHYERAEIFDDLRNQALRLNEETLESRNGVLALLMETGYDESAVSVLAAADGAASLYLSGGGGILGAGQYEQVREVVFETLSEVEKHLTLLDRTDAYPLPEPRRVRFYVVTDRGVLTAEVSEDALGEKEHALSPLFYQVHELIAYIRAVDEHRRSQRSD